MSQNEKPDDLQISSGFFRMHDNHRKEASVRKSSL